MAGEDNEESRLDAETFFGLVDDLLTPPMVALGYNSLGGRKNDQPESRGFLTSVPEGRGPVAALLRALRPRPDREGTPFLLYDFGYEAASDAAQRLQDPEPLDEELWLSYEPLTQQLDLSAWRRIAADRVDWVLWTDHGPCSPAEVRRRLALVGESVLAFGRAT